MGVDSCRKTAVLSLITLQWAFVAVGRLQYSHSWHLKRRFPLCTVSIHTFDFQKVGQGHGSQLSQWRHSMANVKIYKHHFFYILQKYDLCERTQTQKCTSPWTSFCVFDSMIILSEVSIDELAQLRAAARLQSRSPVVFWICDRLKGVHHVHRGHQGDNRLVYHQPPPLCGRLPAPCSHES